MLFIPLLLPSFPHIFISSDRTYLDKMRFSAALATVLAAAGLVSATREFGFVHLVVAGAKLTIQISPALDTRNTGHHTIEVPTTWANVGSPFSFSFSDTVSIAIPLPLKRPDIESN